MRVRILLALTLALLTASCGGTPSTTAAGASPSPSEDAYVPQGWSPLLPSPLPGRDRPRAVAVGGEVLFLGGSTERACPPTADCRGPAPEELRRDGAAYDVQAGAWRRLADAPVPPTSGALAVIGDVVHLLTDNRHLGYDVSEDRWVELPLPPGGVGHRPTSLLAAGDVLVAYQGQTDQPDLVFDPNKQAWKALPTDPLAPSFDRQLLWTSGEVLLLAAELVPQPGSDGPSLQRAALLDLGQRTWRRLPDATDTVTAGRSWTWDGQRALSLSFQEVSGGQVNGYGRSYSTAGALNPRSGTWSLPPTPPADSAPFPQAGVTADSVRWKTTGQALLDAQQDAWRTVPEPPKELGASSGQAWVGDVLVAWGGHKPFPENGATSQTGGGQPVGTGALYRP